METPGKGKRAVVGRTLGLVGWMALAAGVIEGSVATHGALQAVTATGFAGLWTLPILFLVFLTSRSLWFAWQKSAALASHHEHRDHVAVASWIVFLLSGLVVLASVTLVASDLSARTFKFARVASVATAGATALTATLLVAISVPCVTVVGNVLRRLDRSKTHTKAASWFSPKNIAIGAILVVAAISLGAWAAVLRPRLGPVGWAGLLYLEGLAGAFLAGIFAWRAIDPKWQRISLRLIGFAWLAIAAISSYMWIEKPFTVLDVWGKAPIAGYVIDRTFDLETLRDAGSLHEIRPVSRGQKVHPDVFLITIDTLRADRTPVYGGPAKMPAFAALARRGAVFEWAFAPGNTTRRSLPSLATGVSPQRIRGRIAGWALRLDPRHVTVTERFLAAGYDTAGFVCCYSQFGPGHRLGLNRGMRHLTIERNEAKLVDLAVDWIDARQHGENRPPLFVWIHVFQPHEWAQVYPAREYGKPIPPRYDRLLGDTDKTLQKLFRKLSEVGSPSSVVAVTSDHGEGLGDHGAPAHSSDLFNSQIRIPLVVVAPNVSPQRIGSPVGLVDLAPTLLDLAGFEPPTMPTMDGVSLRPLLTASSPSSTPDRPVRASMIKDRSVEHALDAIIVGDYKLIVGTDQAAQLYQYRNDPDERQDLAKQQHPLVAKLQALLQSARRVDAIPPF